MELFKMTGGELHRLMKEKKVSAAEVAEDVYVRISKVENGIGAYITPTPEEAIKAAEAVDKKIAAGEEIHPLAGIPIGIKDNICTKDIKTTCASRMLSGILLTIFFNRSRRCSFVSFSVLAIGLVELN